MRRTALIVLVAVTALTAVGLWPRGHISHGTHRAGSPTSRSCVAADVPGTAIEMVDAHEGWAVLPDLVLHTEDAGHHWREQPVPGGAPLSAVDFVDAQHGWVSGSGRLMSTSDGGATWSVLPAPCPALGSMHFVSATTGFAASGGDLVSSHDGGVSWQRLGTAPVAVQSTCFTTASDGWVGTLNGLARTTDGGATWTRPESPTRPPPDGTEAVQCAGDQAWALLRAGHGESGHVAHALLRSDGSQVWTAFSEATPDESLSVEGPIAPGDVPVTLSAVDASTAVEVDSSPSGQGVVEVGIALDGGAHVLQPTGGDGVPGLTRPVGAAFLSATTGWVLGVSGDAWRILATGDGGTSWTPQWSRGRVDDSSYGPCPGISSGDDPVPSTPHQLQMVSATRGWASAGDRVLGTTDGRTWSVQLQVQGATFGDVDAVDDQDAWVQDGIELWRTTDGGGHWQRLPPACVPLSSVHFMDDFGGYAVGGGVLLSTWDGGVTWQEAASPGRVESVCFADYADGWLGARGSLWSTVDGGASWQVALVRGRLTVQAMCGGWALEVSGGGAMQQSPHSAWHRDAAGWDPIFSEQFFPDEPTWVPSAPSGYPGPVSTVDPSSAVFLDDCPGCGDGTVYADVALDGGRRLLGPTAIPDVTSALGAGFLSTAQGWVLGEARGPATDERRIERTTDGGRSWVVQWTG